MALYSKRCSKCKLVKPQTDFYKRAGSDKLRAACKQCLSAERKEYVAKNQDAIKQANKKQYKARKAARRARWEDMWDS